MTACMGGWCLKRDQCANHNTEARERPAERLCRTGDNDQYIPLPRKWGQEKTDERASELALDAA